MKRTILFLAIMVVSAGTFAKDNFKLSGRIDGVTNDTILIEYVQFTPKKVISNYKIPVKDGKFSFSARLNEAVEADLILKSNTGNHILAYFVPNEEAVFNSPFDYVKQQWSGSQFYQQYQQIVDMLRPFREEFDVAKTLPDSLRSLKNNEINSRLHSLCMKYIQDHPDDDVSATLYFKVGYNYVITAINSLTPRVRNGRFKARIDFDEKYISTTKKNSNARKAVGNDTITIGTQMPELGLKDLDGKVLEFKSLRGKYVVLDFWGSWCTWCIKGFPKLKEYYAKYSDRMEIVGIDCNDTPEKWRAAVEKHKVPWLHVRSDDGIAEAKFRIKGYPYKVLISPEGVVLKAFVGENAAFYTYLDEVLGGKGEY